MLLSGIIWLVTHRDTESADALRLWLGMAGGDTSHRPHTRPLLRGGLMLSAWVWIAIPTILWATRLWWWQQAPAPTPPDREKLLTRPFLISLAILVTVAATIRAPRLDLSLYNDEIDVFRTAIEGTFDRRESLDASVDTLPPFRRVTWADTLWGNRIGNNHALHSLLARVGYDLWHWRSGAPDGTLKEWPLRLPALLGGLLSLAAVASLGKILTGDGRAGLLAGAILAIHPWHLRYSTEARGYGLAFAFGALTVLCLALAMRRHQWRWWLGFGAAQAATLWSCLGSLHLILAINLTAALLFLLPGRNGGGSARFNPLQSPTLPCWVVANLLSAAVFLALAAPILPPLRLAIETNATFSQGPVPGWWPDTLAYLLVGMPWTDLAPDSPDNPALGKYLAFPMVLAASLLAVAATVTGWWRLVISRRPDARLAAIAPCLGLILFWLASELGGSTALRWYGNFATPFFGLWMGCGLHEWLVDCLPGRKSAHALLAATALLAIYAAGVVRPFRAYLHHSKQSLREAVVRVRGGVFPFSESQRAPIVTGWWNHASFYDPYLQVAHTPESLQHYITLAKTGERPLYFILGAREIALAENSRVIDRLENTGEFSLVERLPGLEESQFTLWIYRFEGAPPK